MELQRGLVGKVNNYNKKVKDNKDHYIVKYNLQGFPHAFQVISSNKLVRVLCF